MKSRFGWSTRILAAFLAPWFALTGTEAAPLHQCTMHVMAAAGAHGASSAAMQGMSGMGHAAATPAGDRPDGSREPAPGAPDQRQCNCMGCCCAAHAIVLRAPALLSWLPAAVALDVPRLDTGVPARADAEYVLPFANGPPTALS